MKRVDSIVTGRGSFIHGVSEIYGRHTSFFSNYRLQFYFRTTEVTGVLSFSADKETVLLGDNVKINVELIQPIAMDPQLRFAIREGWTDLWLRFRDSDCRIT